MPQLWADLCEIDTHFVIHRIIFAKPSASGILPCLIRAMVEALTPICFAKSLPDTSNFCWYAVISFARFVILMM